MTRTSNEPDFVGVRSDIPISRRVWLGAAASALGVALFRRDLSAQKAPLPAVTVYRSPTCDCCGKWSQRMQKHGFKVTEKTLDDVVPKKRELGVPSTLFSCHTAVAGAYLFEGHVPPDLVERVIRERLSFRGLAVPGMPQSAPGMDIGHTPYEVLAFERNGKTSVFAKRSS